MTPTADLMKLVEKWRANHRGSAYVRECADELEAALTASCDARVGGGAKCYPVAHVVVSAYGVSVTGQPEVLSALGDGAALFARPQPALATPAQPKASEAGGDEDICEPFPRVHGYDPSGERRTVTVEWRPGEFVGYMRLGDRTKWKEAQPAAYSIDADPAGIRERVASAVLGALMQGAHGTNPPPAGHWLADFWNMARADATHPKASEGKAGGEDADHPLPVFSRGTWIYEGQKYRSQDLNEAAFVAYRDLLTKQPGKALVPTEATDEMVEAGCQASAGKAIWPGDFDAVAKRIRRTNMRSAWVAMLAAAPKERG